MTAPGLTTQGFVATTIDEEVEDLNEKVLANVNASLDLDPDQPIGQIVASFAAKFASAMELGATVYNALNPAAAEANLLANVCALSGTYPQVATYSYVNANLTLTAGTTVAAGAVVAVNGQPTNTWVLVSDVTNSTGSTGPVPGRFRSVQPGPFVANAGTLTVINTPTVGWTVVVNPLDAEQGLTADTDATLRIRRAAEVSGQGSADLDAIRAAVLKVAGVLQCFVFENTSLLTDGNGVPGKAFHVVVWDGVGLSASNNAIAQAIWNTKPGGILSYGATTGNAIDSTGATQIIAFDRAQQMRTYVSCTTTPGTLTSPQTTAIKYAIAAYALANFGLGSTLVALSFRASALVTGINTDVPLFAFDFHSSPVNTGNLTTTGLQIATVDTGDILVNGV